MIHRLLNLWDEPQPITREVQTLFHHSQDGRKLNELFLLRRNQWICFEERHDSFDKILSSPHVEDHQVLPVVVVSAIAVDFSASEVVPQEFEGPDAAFSLHNRKTRLALPSQSHHTIAMNGTAKTAFSVDEADDPLLNSWPFLLIVRTEHIFTEQSTPPNKARNERVVPDTRGFQQIASC
jgi:hypothetical protein